MHSILSLLPLELKKTLKCQRMMCVQSTGIKGYKVFHFYQILPLYYPFFRSTDTYMFCQSSIHIDALSFIISLDSSSHFHLRRLYGDVSFPSFTLSCQLRNVPLCHRAQFIGTDYYLLSHLSCPGT